MGRSLTKKKCQKLVELENISEIIRHVSSLYQELIFALIDANVLVDRWAGLSTCRDGSISIYVAVN